LPAPDGPTMPTNAPWWTVSVTLSRTGAPSNAHRTASTSIANAGAVRLLDDTTAER